MTIANFIDRLNAAHGTDTRTFDTTRPGRRFTRIIVTTHGATAAYGFIDNATGNLLKADGFRGPARGTRGNIADPIPTHFLFAFGI